IAKTKETLLADRERARQTRGGLICFEYNEALAAEMSPEAREKELAARWTQGGFAFLGAHGELMATKEANDIAADCARAQMRARVAKPEIAEKLMPYDHPVGVKRLCLDTGYLEIFNQPNVELVDVREAPIERITKAGVLC